MDRYRLALTALVGMLLFGLFSSFKLQVEAASLSAAQYSPSEVIQLVNALRSANGLPAYRSNSALMRAAQAHSEYQAATGNASHTGKNGSRPHDRAVANGYGGGAAVSVSENIYSGSNASAAQAVGWWQGDGLHLGTMLSSSYRDVGAGLAEANGVNYYTLVVGYISGEQGQPPAGQPGSGGSPSNPPEGAPDSTPGADTPVAWLVPIQLATPSADGSLVHEVQYGQFLYNIADAYKVELPYLLVLNGISASTVIYPGDKLLIRPAQATPTLQASPTVESTPTPAFTPTPVRVTGTPVPTSTPQEVQSVVKQQDSTPLAGAPLAGAAGLSPGENPTSGSAAQAPEAGALVGEPANSQGGFDPILAVIGGLVVVGTALLLLGSLLKRQA